MCSLLSLLPPIAACSRRSESAPAASETRPQANPVAPSPEPPSVDQRRVYSVGQQAAGPGYQLTVKRVLECSGRDGWRPAPDRLFLGVELETSANDESIAIGHSHVKLRYRTHQVIAAEPFVRTVNCEPLLKYTRLAAHERLSAWVVFSLPKTASSLELQVRPRQFLNDQATFFDLGR